MTARAGYAALLARPAFRWYWLSQAVGDAGYAVYAISIVWLGYRLSGSAAVVGLLLGVEFAVYACSFVAGAVIDRIRDLRSVLLVGYPLQAAGAFALGALLVTGRLSVPVLLGLVAAISFVWDFTWTANNALPPELVGEGELLRANSLVSAVSGGNQIAGYAVGGALLLLVGPAGGQFLYGALNLAAAGLAVLIAVPGARTTAAGGLFDRLREGWVYLGGAAGRTVRSLAGFGSLQGALSLAPALLITLSSAQLYPQPAVTYGILFTAFAVGGVAGSLVLGGWVPTRRLAAALFGATAVEGLLVAGAVLSAPLLPLSAVAWFGVGTSDVVFWTVLLAYVQARTPRPLLGRTITNVYFFRGSTRATGIVLLGFAGTLVAARSLGIEVGLLFLAVALAGYLAFPAIRRLGY